MIAEEAASNGLSDFPDHIDRHIQSRYYMAGCFQEDF
jgi:hypothetical protein